MVASTNTLAAIARPSKQENTERRTERVETSAKWGIIAALLNLAYGERMIARRLTPDPRQDSWFLMRSPVPTCLLCLCYVVGVAHVGPRFMESRKPIVGLRPLMVAYNAFQVVFSAWLLYETGMGGWFGSYNLLCQPCDFTTDPQAVRMMHASYWYYFSKFIDFLDTVFFVLHKKYEHISPLHVVHHSLMPVNMWYGVRYQPGGHSTLMGFLNCFVHVVMYTYYLLAAMGPRVRPFLWWKKYLTTLQMVQFLTVILHSIQSAFRDCPGVPPQFTWWICGNAAMFFLLFADFYLQAYSSSRRKVPTPQDMAKPSIICGTESNGVDKRSSNGIANGISGDISSAVARRGVLNGRPHSLQDDGHL